MKKTKKKLILKFSLFFIFVFLAAAKNAYAQGLSTETIPQYIKSLYTIGLMLVGVSAFAMLVYCGYLYMIGGVNAAAITKAKECVFNALMGLVLLITAVLILRTINPQLIELKWDGIKLTDRQQGILEELKNKESTEVYAEKNIDIFYGIADIGKCDSICQGLGGNCERFISGTGKKLGRCFNIPNGKPCKADWNCHSGKCKMAVVDKSWQDIVWNFGLADWLYDYTMGGEYGWQCKS